MRSRNMTKIKLPVPRFKLCIQNSHLGKDNTRDKTIFRIPFYLWLYLIAPKKCARMRVVVRTKYNDGKREREIKPKIKPFSEYQFTTDAEL